MRSFRSAVDFARSSSRECLRRCQRRGLFLSVGNGEAGGGSGGDIGDGERSAQEILEYRLFREFCETTATHDGNNKHGSSVGGRNGGLGADAVRLRRSRSVSCSESLQRAHRRQAPTVANGSVTTATATEATIASTPSCDGPAPSVKMRSQRAASSVVRLSRKLRHCEVVLLDGSEATFALDPSSKAQALLDLVCQFLSITERQYFGLCYKDPALGVFQWLNSDKRLGKQLDATWPTWRLDFAVKFYPARPENLSDGSARSCVALQVRQCLVAGRLPCSTVSYALLGSYLMQSELGDRRIGADVDEAVVDEPAFCPPELLTAQPGVARLARRLHACHAGLASREAERQLLANVRRLAAYGLDVHAARCVNGDDRNAVDGEVEVLVGVCSDGLVLMRPEGLLRLARLTWPRVTALTRRGRELHVALRRQPLPRSSACVTAATATVRLRCDNGRMARRLWRSAVEHHAFFRLRSRDSSVRERIQSGTVRLSRSCFSGVNFGVGFAGRASSTYLTAPSNAALQRSTSLSYQRRAVSMNPVGDTGTRPATLVTPEDIDDSACQVGAVAPSNRQNSAEVPRDALEILAREAAESQSVWCDDQFDQTSNEPSSLDRSATTEGSAINGSSGGRRFLFNSNSSTYRFDSSSTDYNQEHDRQPTTTSDVASGSPVSRQPPSGEETPSGGQQDEIEDCGRIFFRSPELVQPTVRVDDADHKTAVGLQKRTTAAAEADAAAVEGELSRVSVVETRTETMEINEPVEELVNFTDEHGNSVTRKVFRCRTIRRIVTDTVVESPLSAWYLYCQENKVDEATMSAVLEQLRLKRAQEASRSCDEGFV